MYSNSKQDKLLIRLHKILNEQFDQSELQTLCFHLGIDYDDLPGESKINKAEKLIFFFKRRKKISKLIETISDLRPEITFEETEANDIESIRLSVLDMDGWHILSGEKYHDLYPNTFWIPEEGIRRNLQPGDFVKLIFEFATSNDPYSGDTSVERMWVKVTGVRKPYYLGELSNFPAFTDLLKLGDEIIFLPEQVINIEGE